MKVRFYIVDGRLFQWDTGRKVAIVLPEGERIDQVHFAKYGDGQALVTEPYVYEEQLVADVPNILLN